MFSNIYVTKPNTTKRRAQSMQICNKNVYRNNNEYNMGKSMHPSPKHHIINIRDRQTIFDQMVEKQYKKYPHQHRSPYEQRVLDRSCGLREKEQNFYESKRCSSSVSPRTSGYLRQPQDNQFDIYQESYLLQQQYQQDIENKKQALKLQVQKKLQQIKEKIKEQNKTQELRELRQSASMRQSFSSSKINKANDEYVEQMYVYTSPTQKLNNSIQQRFSINQQSQISNINKSELQLSTTSKPHEQHIQSKNKKYKKRSISANDVQQIDTEHENIKQSIAQHNISLNQEIKNILIDFKGAQYSQIKYHSPLVHEVQASPKIQKSLILPNTPEQKQKSQRIISPNNKKCQIRDKTFQFEINFPPTGSTTSKQSIISQHQAKNQQQQQQQATLKQSVKFNLSDLELINSTRKNERSNNFQLKLDDIDKSYSSIDNYRYQDEALSSDYEDIMTQETKTNLTQANHNTAEQISCIVPQQQETNLSKNIEHYAQSTDFYIVNQAQNQQKMDIDGQPASIILSDRQVSPQVKRTINGEYQEVLKTGPITGKKSEKQKPEKQKYNALLIELAKRYHVGRPEDDPYNTLCMQEHTQLNPSHVLQKNHDRRQKAIIDAHNEFLKQTPDVSKLSRNKILLEKLSCARQKIREQHQQEQISISKDQEDVWRLIKDIRDQQFKIYQKAAISVSRGSTSPPRLQNPQLERKWDEDFKKKLAEIEISQQQTQNTSSNHIKALQNFSAMLNRNNNISSKDRGAEFAAEAKNDVMEDKNIKYSQILNGGKSFIDDNSKEKGIQNKISQLLTRVAPSVKNYKKVDINQESTTQINEKHLETPENDNKEDSDNYTGDLYNDDSKSPQKRLQNSFT